MNDTTTRTMFKMPESVFKHVEAQYWDTYNVTIQIEGAMAGSLPGNAKMLEAFVRHRMGITEEEEIHEVTRRLLSERLGKPLSELQDDDVKHAPEGFMTEVAETIALQNTNGFKRDRDGKLYIGSYVVNAMLREKFAILWTGEKRGEKTGYKGQAARSYLIERVFVKSIDPDRPDRIYLEWHEDVEQWDGSIVAEFGRTSYQTHPGRVQTPQGPMSIITRYEVANQPMLRFQVKVLRQNGKPALSEEEWKMVWLTAEANAIGAARGLQYGHFRVTQWELARPGDVNPNDEADTAKADAIRKAQNARKPKIEEIAAD